MILFVASFFKREGNSTFTVIIIISNWYSVTSLLMTTPYKGHDRKNLHIKDIQV